MSWRAASLLLGAVVAVGAWAEEFSFDAGEFEKKTFEYSGYLEQKVEGLRLRDRSSGFRLAYPDEAGRSGLLRSTTTLELSGKLNLDPVVADVRMQAWHARDELQSATERGQVMEGGLRWSAGPGLTLDAGKRVLRWGKGYAWSPVGFVERTKDASDPQASREGFSMLSGEWTKRLPGALSSIAFTALVVPTDKRLNPDFGSTRDLNPAARLSLLLWDADVDFLWRGEGARPASYGFDFSRNFGSALEVHSEWARGLGVPRTVLAANGTTGRETRDTTSWLFGLRYLTPGEITWIVEYYRNGNGYSRQEMDDYYRFLEVALAPGAAPALESKARNVAQSAYARPNPGSDYLYAKVSASEPLGWVYGALAVAAMTNLKDRSWQLVPEVSYTGFNNVELRGRLFLLGGTSNTEFGEKAAGRRLEVYARFYF